MLPRQVDEILNSQRDKLEGDAKIFSEHLDKDNVSNKQTDQDKAKNQKQYDKLIGAKQKWRNDQNDGEVHILQGKDKDKDAPV